MKNQRKPEYPIGVIDETINGITGKSMIFKSDKEWEKYDGKIKAVKAFENNMFFPLRIKLSEINKDDICHCCSQKANNCECYSLYKYYRGKSCLIHDIDQIKRAYNL